MRYFYSITYNFLRSVTLCCLLCCLSTQSSLHAQSVENRTQSFHFYFQLASAAIDSTLDANAAQLTALDRCLDEVLADTALHIVHVSLRGLASPDGNHSTNLRYSRERARAVERLVRQRVHIPDSIITRSHGVAWEEFAAIVRNSRLRDKDAILKIISRDGRIVNVTPGYQTDSRVLALQKIDYGYTWLTLKKNYFSPLRSAEVEILAKRTLPPPLPIVAVDKDSLKMPTYQAVAPPPLATETIIESTPTPTPPTETAPAPTSAPQETIIEDTEEPKAVEVEEKEEDILGITTFHSQAPFCYQLDFKTNAVGWAMGMINGALEVDLCPYVSFNVPIYYSAYDYFVQTIKFRTFMVQPEFRFWFRPQNEGWFVGAHFGMGYYNIAVNGDYRIQDHNGETPALGGGLAVGYRMPIAKSEHWKVEFSIGAGAYAVHYDKFYNSENGLMIPPQGEDTSQKRVYWGPDQVNISFIYSLNLQEGGGR